LSSVSIKDARMKADGPRLDGAATSDGGGQGRAGASFVPKEGGGRAKNISRATPDPGEAASWERTTTTSSFI